MSRPLLLDLFCGAGGAAMGYHRAGFDVVGVDIKPQPHYPFDFYQVDWKQGLDDWVLVADAVHASPPCQAYSRSMRHIAKPRETLIDDVRDLLRGTGLPFVIENVVGAPLRDPTILCGQAMGLPFGMHRHRLFELHGFTSFSIRCRRDLPNLNPYGNSDFPRTKENFATAMEIDWMTGAELTEAIPPTYTEFIGRQLLDVIAADPILR